MVFSRLFLERVPYSFGENCGRAIGSSTANARCVVMIFAQLRIVVLNAEPPPKILEIQTDPVPEIWIPAGKVSTRLSKR